MAALAACVALSGCVSGYGGCLWLQPFKHTLTGRVHYRSFPAGEGADRVPVLSFDGTEYLYSPARSLMCIPVNEVQLTGFAEFPNDILENDRVTVTGKLYETASGREHTRFAMNVITLLPIHPRPTP